MKNNNLAVFDLDGVILESVECKTTAFKKLYSAYGTDIQNKVEKHHIENGGVSRFDKIKFYHTNYLNINLSDYEFKKLLNKYSELVLESVLNSKFVNNVEYFIKELSKKYTLIISTGTPTNEAVIILKHKKIFNFFTNIYGSPETKNQHIKKIFQGHQFEKNYFFGDALSDYNAAIGNNMKFILRVHKTNTFMTKKDNIFKKINDFKDISVSDL